MTFESCNQEYYIFDDYDNATKYAIEITLDEMDEILNDKYTKYCCDHFGNDVFDIDDIENEIKNYYETDYDDMSEEDAIDELLSKEIIEDTDEYFDVDDDGETDHGLPKFRYMDYEEEYVESMMDDIDDVVEYFALNYGYNELKYFINKDKLAKEIVDEAGNGEIISSYDGEEKETRVDGVDYYIYRMN